MRRGKTSAQNVQRVRQLQRQNSCRNEGRKVKFAGNLRAAVKAAQYPYNIFECSALMFHIMRPEGRVFWGNVNALCF
jgi:hypothetical protein